MIKTFQSARYFFCCPPSRGVNEGLLGDYSGAGMRVGILPTIYNALNPVISDRGEQITVPE